MKKILLLLFGVLICQDVFADISSEDRRLEEQKRRELEHIQQVQPSQQSPLDFNTGLWLHYRFTDYSNLDNDDESSDALKQTSSIDARWWANFSYQSEGMKTDAKTHFFYLRLKNLYIYREGSNPGKRQDNDGPHVDYAYLSLDYKPLVVETGRRYFNLGRGIALSNVLDGVQLNWLIPGWNIGVFAAQDLPHSPNIDLSVPGFDKTSDRYFYGAGLGFAPLAKVSVYSFALGQTDFSDEYPVDSAQQYTYDSQYWGVGAKGNISTSSRYWLEVIRQTGESHVFGTDATSDVDAWALDMLLERDTLRLLNTTWSFEYAFGSGDGDRQSVTDTAFGNTFGRDRNFLYFGYLNTGFALSPRLSNLHMLRVGSSSIPFLKSAQLGGLQIAIDYYWFWKDETNGAVSDFEATESNRFIGQEIDVALYYVVADTWSIDMEYGYFFPGEAYSQDANDGEQYFSVGVTKTF